MNAFTKPLSDIEKAYEDRACSLSFDMYEHIESLTDWLVSGKALYYWVDDKKTTLVIEDATAKYIDKKVSSDKEFGGFAVKQTRVLFKGRQPSAEHVAAQNYMAAQIRLIAFDLISENYNEIIEEQARTDHPDAA